MSILVVDDSTTIQKIVADILTRHGFKCDSALDGQIAINLLRQGNRYELILLDWNMPLLQGPEVLDLIFFEQLHHCPIIMMTTENNPSKIVKALAKGATEYLMKPFTEEILLERMSMAKQGAA